MTTALQPAPSAPYGLEQARLGLRYYLRALWRREFKLRPCERNTQLRPFLSEHGIHLPHQYHSHRGPLLRDLYRAAAAHAAAHAAYSTSRFERQQLKPVQLAIIGVLEDARVELLAISDMPGLRRLWLKFFDHRGRDGTSAEALLIRLAHALLDPQRIDDNPWVMKGVRHFRESQRHGSNPQVLREIGSQLGNDLGQMRVQFNAKSYLVEPLYRDDNLYLWDSEAPPEETRIDDHGFHVHDDATQAVPAADDNAPDEQGLRPREVAGPPDEQGGTDFDHPTYPEWDQRIGIFRPNWCRVIEQVPPVVDTATLRDTLARHAVLSARLAQLLHARKQGRPQRLRRQQDGDAFELDALVRLQADLRSGIAPELRLHRRTRLQKPDLSVLLLLDLSASTNEALMAKQASATGTLVKGSPVTLLSLIRESSVLLGDAIAQGGDQLAIHGFRSNGRHEVNYLRFKEFGQAMDDKILGRIGSVDGALSTRLGAAIRHASRLMQKSRSTQRLIIVLTDGEPHDIDVFHPGLLVHDAARAVARSNAEGTPVFCVSVDPGAEAYVQKIFGAHHYLLIDCVEQLPQRLPELYLKLSAW
ncbi:MAG: hypothetical protein RL404_670 [Pseudomonadota bacterium]